MNEPADESTPPATELDRWIRSRLAGTVERVTERMEDYDTTFAGRAIADFVDDLSNWYVRLSRRRFWDGDPARASRRSTDCLVTTAKLLAPLTPFIADEIYDNLDGTEPSVHLCDYPEPGARDEELEWQMQVLRDAVELGRAARAHAKQKVRQPLREAVVVAADRERGAIEQLEDLLAQELNVKSVRIVSEADELGRFELKPNWRALGPRFGKQMPQVAAAIAALDPARLRAGGRAGINVEGQDHEIGPDDVQMTLQPLDGYQVERSGTHAVALNLELDDELRREALAREVVHAVQAARKSAGLNVEDRIALSLGGHADLLDAARAHEDYLTRETLATELDYDGGDGAAAEIEGRELLIAVRAPVGSPPMRHLPPLLLSRPFGQQLILAILVPMVFGIVTGIALGLHAVLYWVLAGPLAIGGGFLGGLEHQGADEGFARGAIGGLVFGSFILLGFEMMNTEPKTYLGEPQVGLVFATTFFGCILGAFGGGYRARRERELGTDAAAV